MLVYIDMKACMHWWKNDACMHARSVYTHVYVAQINSWYFMQCAFNILRFMYVAMLA